jgi:glycine/D-amino acid oxidase-like deaminating enzyme
MTREESLERLERRRFDLLVVGAGIVGTRVAYEAARDGLSVALVDAGDYGGGTSSASSKLLHGGLRYLATGDVALVRQLQLERREIATRIAPHLVEPLPLVLAVDGSSRVRAAKLAVALPLYAALSGFGRPRPRRIRVGAAAGLIPPLQTSAVAACGVVTEVLTHDARLTLATARAAARNGAATASYVRVIGLESGAAVVEDVRTHELLRVRCRAIVNAAGASVDAVRRLERRDAAPLVRLSLGVHAVVPLVGAWSGGLALFDDTGSAIAIPWQGMLVIGATDVPYTAGTGPVTGDPAHVEQLLARFAEVLPRDQVHPDRVVHTFAGLRVLPLGEVATPRASRRHVGRPGRHGLDRGGQADDAPRDRDGRAAPAARRGAAAPPASGFRAARTRLRGRAGGRPGGRGRSPPPLRRRSGARRRLCRRARSNRPTRPGHLGPGRLRPRRGVGAHRRRRRREADDARRPRARHGVRPRRGRPAARDSRACAGVGVPRTTAAYCFRSFLLLTQMSSCLPSGLFDAK